MKIVGFTFSSDGFLTDPSDEIIFSLQHPENLRLGDQALVCWMETAQKLHESSSIWNSITPDPVSLSELFCRESLLLQKKLEGLNAVFQDSFLHYTTTYPDHWTAAGKDFLGFLDLPHNGALLELANLASIHWSHPGPLAKEEMEQLCDQWTLQPYLEFLSAMRPRMEKDECLLAFLLTAAAAEIFTDFPSFQSLSKAFLERLTNLSAKKSSPSIFPPREKGRTFTLEIHSPYAPAWNGRKEPGRSIFSKESFF